MSSCPFSDLVVVLLVAVVAVLLLQALAWTRRSMRLGINGWNKSSSMLRSVRLSPSMKIPSFRRSGKF
uniref:Uncharacterized protein n=1 Tax=Arundo donax TaxID=35708 RepID=A0A0A9DKZ3_ARUDO